MSSKAGRCVIIVGMHRSGTSAVAGSLQQAGLYLGNVGTQAPDNRKGNREPPLLNVLHEELLAANNGSWSEPPAQVRWERIHRACRDLFIASFADRELWGFKDPRTVLTLAEWLSVLPHAELVGVFRHPDHVARSLKARDGLCAEDGLKLWMIYNRALLWWAERRPDLRLVEFGSDPNTTEQAVRELIATLDLPGAKGITSQPFFDRSLINSTGKSVELDDSAAPEDLTNAASSLDQARAESLTLYAKLQARSPNRDPSTIELEQKEEEVVPL